MLLRLPFFVQKYITSTEMMSKSEEITAQTDTASPVEILLSSCSIYPCVLCSCLFRTSPPPPLRWLPYLLCRPLCRRHAFLYLYSKFITPSELLVNHMTECAFLWNLLIQDLFCMWYNNRGAAAGGTAWGAPEHAKGEKKCTGFSLSKMTPA